jgi:hypothetical protein
VIRLGCLGLIVAKKFTLGFRVLDLGFRDQGLGFRV